MSDWVRVGPAKDFTGDGVFAVKVGSADICVVRLGESLHALDNQCTHAEARLSAGDVEDGEVVCPLHGARFDARTGEALTPPATTPVRTHGIKVEGGDVFVRLSDIPAIS